MLVTDRRLPRSGHAEDDALVRPDHAPVQLEPRRARKRPLDEGGHEGSWAAGLPLPPAPSAASRRRDRAGHGRSRHPRHPKDRRPQPSRVTPIRRPVMPKPTPDEVLGYMTPSATGAVGA